MSNKKRILCPGWSTGDQSWGVTKPYLEFFSQYGQVEILTPRKEIVEGDLLILPGWLDVSPRDYKHVPGFYTGNTDVYKDYFMHQNLPQYIEMKMPIFGICLGFQQLCVTFGSQLTQHMYHPTSSPRNELTHLIRPVVGFDAEKGYLMPADKKKGFKVNSLHHQGVHQYELGEDLQPLYLDEQGWFVEIVKHKTLPIAGVQFHPEELDYIPQVDGLIKSLLNE